ncbi:peptide/nickel transport system permease protein [Micromonospora pisi]|uniref:Peptide/nickel transport system permease protein n=1 Tax=Micromonospora pisi TaxID=589240 RepID=A0A495JHW0_9ACTN|nr:ABC transporter permease [Micromonospora pisi]RKR88345.1 peptide/nickel transport system permease protein [Micromonospora pisi]
MIARRLARTALLVLAATAVVFAATEVLPGDAGTLRDPGRASPEQVAQARDELGLDQPVAVRYLRWLGGLLRGDLGRSLSSDRPVSDLLGQRLPATASLVAAALVVTVLLTAAGLLVAHLRRGRGGTLAAGLAAVPQAVYAAALGAVLSGMLGWLPAVSLLPPGGHPWQEPQVLVLPALTLALPSAAFACTLLRGALTDTLHRPHVVDAYRRGLSPSLVLRRHVLPFLLVPMIQVLVLTTGWLVAGTALVETVYGFPGLGGLLVSAVAVRDVPVVQGAALIPIATVLVGMLLADLAAATVHRTAGPATRRPVELTVGVP